MLQSEMQETINRLNNQLDLLRQNKTKAKIEQDELVRIIDKIDLKAREIENGLFETLSNIDQKLTHVNPKSQFPTRYKAAVQTKILNSKSSNALETTRQAVRDAKTKYYDLDDTIAQINSQISQVENEIARLQNMINEGGG